MLNNECKLILALDLPSFEEVQSILSTLKGEIHFVKVGLQLFTKYGPDIVKRISDYGCKIFLDLKLHDIPNTVASSIRSLKGLPVELLTIHAMGGEEMIRWAVQARDEIEGGLNILAVTVLTSMDDAGLQQIGISSTPKESVEKLGKLAVDAGVQGLVCSGEEISLLREAVGTRPLLVVPGIRPKGSEAGEQKRIVTPAEAKKSGATHIVVGRPILKAQDPKLAVQMIEKELHG